MTVVIMRTDSERSAWSPSFHSDLLSLSWIRNDDLRAPYLLMKDAPAVVGPLTTACPRADAAVGKGGVMIRRALAILGIALATSGPAFATDDRYSQQVETQIEIVSIALADEGWGLERVFMGSLPEGGLDAALARLATGRQYVIVGVCDEYCYDLDLMLTDAFDNVIDISAEPDAFPVVGCESQFTTPYTVAAEMVGCALGACDYALAVFSR